MKKVEKRLLSWLMVVAMVLSVVHFSVPVKAEEHSVSDSKVDIGTPSMDGTDNSISVERAKYKFNETLNIEGTEIRSVSVQFVSVATKGVEEIKYTSENASESTKKLAEDIEISSLTSGNKTHLILNSKKNKDKGDILPLKAEEWENILKECISIYIKSDEIRSIMVSVSEKVDFGNINLIEYNANNGHYYELVQSKENWDSARENSLKADSMGPLYESYLVNITSSNENAFVYTICRTTSWIGTTCDPNAKLEGSYDENSKTITYKGNIYDRYGYTLDDEKYRRENKDVIAYWFYVDGPEAGKVMTYGPAQADYYYGRPVPKNTMQPAKIDEPISFSKATAYGAYETDIDIWENHGDNNWSNPYSFAKSALYEAELLTDGNNGINEPNNCPYDDDKKFYERYMVIYSFNDHNTYKWMIPSMWNDFDKDNTKYIGSYIIEYSPKPGEVPDVTLDNKQSIVELDGKKNQTITGEKFGVRGNTDPNRKPLTVDDIVKEENGNVVVTVKGNPSKLEPEVSPEDLKKLNDAIGKNESDIVTVTVKDKTTGQEIPLQITIVPQNVIALKSAELDPYRKEPGTEDRPAHYIAGEKVTLKNVTLNDGTVYTGDKLTNGNFTYQWQYAENDTDWKNIDGATDISLSPELTQKYAGDKVRLEISVGNSGEVKDIVSDKNKKLYVDGDGYSDKADDVNGTYIDSFIIDASDFIVELDKVSGMDDDKAIDQSKAKAQLQKANGGNEDKKVTDSDVEDKLQNVIAPGDVNVTFNSEWLTYSAKDKDGNTGKTVVAHVVNNKNSEKNNGKQYEIGANNITVSTTTAKTFENADKDSDHASKLANKAGVVVISDGTTLDSPIISVEYNKDKPLKAEVDDYEVTYVYEYTDGKTVKVPGIVKVEDPFFDVTATNPNPISPAKPEDGVEGPVKDEQKSKEKDYIYRIHLDHDVSSVELEPEIVNADIIKLTVDDNEVDVPANGIYTVKNVPTDNEVKVKYTVESEVEGDDFGTIYNYTYIIDRAKSDNVDVDTKTTDPIPGEDSDNPKIDDSEGPKDETIDGKSEQVKDIKITVPYKVTSLEVKPELKDPAAQFVTDFGNKGILKSDGTTIEKSLVTAKTAAFTVTDLKVGSDSVVAVKAISEDRNHTCVYRYTITRDRNKGEVNIVTTADPVPADSEDKPVIDDSAEPEKDGKEVVKKIIITVPSAQNKVVVYPKPEKGEIDKNYNEGNGLKKISGPANVKNNMKKDNPSFTVDELSSNEDTVVRVRGISEDRLNSVIYEYTIKRAKDDNVNVNTVIPDPTPGEDSDKPVIDDTEEPKDETIDGIDEQVKDIKITVPHNVTSLEIVPTREDSSSTFDTQFGNKGIMKSDVTTIDPKSSVAEKSAKIIVNELKVDKDSVVAVKVKAADNNTTCVYRYTIVREKNNDATLKDVTPEPESTDKVKYVDIVTDQSDYTWPIKLNDPNATVESIEKKSGNGDITNPEDKSSFTVSGLKPQETTVVNVVTKAENGVDTLTYVVRITNNEKADDDPEKGVLIKTTADPDPSKPDDKPIVDDSDEPEKVGDELVKKITITVPSNQNNIKVYTNPKEGALDLTYSTGGLKVSEIPDDGSFNNNLNDTIPSFTINNLSANKDTLVSVRGVSKDGKNAVIYEYTIKRLDDDNVNVNTGTTDPTPDDISDDAKISDPEGPKDESIDGNDEQVKDVKITVPNKVTNLEVVPTREDPSSTFDTTFGVSGIKVVAGTTVDANNSSVNPKDAKFTVTDLKVSEPSVVMVKVKSADGTKTCVYRYSIEREKNNDATIKDVTPTPGATDDEKIVEITADQPEYTWPIELNDPNATVESIDKADGNGNLTYPEGKNYFKLTDLKPGETTVVKVVTKAENGDKLTYLVKVTNNSVPEPTALGTTSDTVNPADIVYEKTNPQDKIEPIDPGKKIAASNALKINGVLVPDDMYSVSPDGKRLIISRDYLATLTKGTYPAVLTYADGTEQKFNVSILDYDETTLVKNPPLFSMYKEIVLKKKNTFTVNLKGISDYAQVSSKITAKGKKAKSVVKIKQQKNGDVLITPKKTGKTQVTCTIIQNGAEYKVVVDIKVLKQYKGTSKNFNLKTKGLVKTSGELPEFNVYKRIVKGKNTKIKFTKVATDAKVKFYVASKKEAKSLKIGKIKRKGKTATCTIVGKKKGWVHLTAEITQNGKTYYTRLLVRIDDGTWSNKQMNKYLK